MASDRDAPQDGNYEAQAGDANLPRPDPTRLTTALVDRALAAFREVVETRLHAMDSATSLLQGQIDKIAPELAEHRLQLRRELEAEIRQLDEKSSARSNSLRELLESRLGSMDRATELLAADIRQQVPSTVERAVSALQALIEQRLADMDTATTLRTASLEQQPAEIRAEIGHLRELLESRINGMDEATKLLAVSVDTVPSDIDRAATVLRESFLENLTTAAAETRRVADVAQERFGAVDGLFAQNALALTAALAAQEKAVAEQNKSNSLAITKSEISTKETIAANAAQTATGLQGLLTSFNDMKERIVRLEAGGVATSSAKSEHRLDTGTVLQALITLAAVISIIIVILKK